MGKTWAVLVVLMAVVAMTTGATAACDPNYRSKTCVPIAADVDCLGGKGDGPEFVQGPFEYEGDDVYDLDVEPDGSKDGIACEPPPTS